MTDWRAVRRLVPEVLSALVRGDGHFDAREDAVQEALLVAAAQWPVQGWRDKPKAWLVTVASRRVTDQLRSNAARRRREEAEAARTPPPLDGADFGDAGSPPARDDALTLLFLCCHPGPVARVAGRADPAGRRRPVDRRDRRGLPRPRDDHGPTHQPGQTAHQGSRSHLRAATAGEHARRLGVVVHVLYLIFNEGYTATSGTQLVRAE